MKVEVKLYGTLSLQVPDYKASRGLEVEIPDGATVKELLDHLEISETRGAVVIIDGRASNANDKIQDGGSVNIFQIIRGG